MRCAARSLVRRCTGHYKLTQARHCGLPLHALILPLLIGSGIHADAQTAGATDNEHYAAFCTGVLAAETEASPKPTLETIELQLRRSSPAVSPDEARKKGESELPDALKIWNKDQSEREAKRQRFAAFLIARGVFADANLAGAVQGIATAAGQGRQATAQCLELLSHCLETALADRAAVDKKLASCVSAEPCPKVARCNQSDGLPF